MLTSSGSGPISPIRRPRTYYPPRRLDTDTTVQATTGRNYDSAAFSPIPEERSSFLDMVSHLSQEVRTATTTGDIQALRQQVASGEYTPDPEAIAARMLLLSED